ncbi:MAG: hypothetical protein V4733_00825 [Verrucomicrobiota bacterium]
MKFTTTTVLAAIAATGIAAFVAGRASSGKTVPSAEQESVERISDAGNRDRSGRAPTGTAARRTENSARTGSRAERFAEIESIIRGANPLDRSRAWLEWVDNLSPSEFQGAVEQFRALGITDSRFGEYALLLSAWAKADPITALDYTSKNTRGNFATATVLASWATMDPDAAIQWAETAHTGTGANPHMAAVIRGIAGTDPNRATHLLTSMPRSQERGEALDAILPHLTAQGAEAARSWIAQLADDSLRNGAMLRSAESLATIDPQGTVRWLMENPSEATQRRMDDVFSTWASKDSAAATAAFQQLPAGNERSNALRGIIENLATNNPTAAISLMGQNPGDVNDRTVGEFVWNSLRDHPEAAVGQIPRITDQRNRERTYARTLSHWLRRDPAAAGTWLQNNPLPENVTNRLPRN